MTKRRPSEETELRQLLRDVANHVLEIKAELQDLKENQRKDNIVIGARLNEIETEVHKLHQSGVQIKAAVEAVQILAHDAMKKTTDLHFKFIGSANTLGARLHDLEQERRRRESEAPTRRPSGRRRTTDP